MNPFDKDRPRFHLLSFEPGDRFAIDHRFGAMVYEVVSITARDKDGSEVYCKAGRRPDGSIVTFPELSDLNDIGYFVYPVPVAKAATKGVAS